jgi:hypothetical protein
MLKSIGKGQTSMLGLSQYQPMSFESKTTNQKTYKGFKLQGKPIVQTQKVAAVHSKALPTHFDTSNKNDFVKHNFKVSQLDMIPYP